MGLLQKTLQISDKKEISVSNLFGDGILFYALFEKFENHFFITNSIGLDSKSILLSFSTSDFWEGSIKKRDCWNYFTEEDNSISQFFQFFSIQLKDNIKSIAVFFSSENKIFITAGEKKLENLSDSFAEQIESVFNKIKFSLKNPALLVPQNSFSYKITIETKEYIDSIILQNLTDKTQIEQFNESLSNELSNRFYVFFNSPNCCFQKNNNNFKIILFCKNQIKKELIHNHLINRLKDFADENSTLLKIELEKADSEAELLEFLQAE